MPRKSWWARLPFGIRMTAGAGALLLVIGGGAAGVATLTGDDSQTLAAHQGAATEPDLGAPQLDEDPEVVSRAAAAAEPLPDRHSATPTHASTAAPPAEQLTRARAGQDRADRTGPRPTRTVGEPAERNTPAPPAQPEPAPVVTTRTDVETRPIPFPTRLVRDSSLPRGTKRIQAPGVPGQETLRYLVTLVDGKPSDRRLVDTAVTKKPEPRVVAFGARRKPAKECGRALRLCVPLGRSAVCPDGRGEQSQPPAGQEAREESSTVQLGGSVLLSEEDLELLNPETLDDVRLEPATLC
ncbi:G5 domain-containing protein [Actinoplanes sp. NPDC024001]|uniref:G5 domain-containing protein n=1 Tax=Actinoplanes sp. NPDC024001 TaxID=3154598 RepID=UPI0033C88BD1